jgi:hypothetical protein
MTTRTKSTPARMIINREAAARTAKANTESLALLERLRETMPDCDPGRTSEADAARAESIRAGLKFLAKSLGLAA